MPEPPTSQTIQAQEKSALSGICGSQSREGLPAGARVMRSVLIFALLGAILYGAATLVSDYRAVLSALMAFPRSALALLLGMVFIGWLLRGWRFHYYLLQSGVTVPLRYAIFVFLASFALTGTPGKVGEAVKGVFLKQDYGVPITKVVGILVIERLMDLWGVLLLGSFSLLLFKGWAALFLLCAAVVVAVGVFLCMERVYRPVLEWCAGISLLSWMSRRILDTLLTGRELMTARIFVVGLVVSALAWGLESVSMYVILKGLGLKSTLLQANFIYCFSTLVGAVSMLPGGIGSTEAGMMGLLTFTGINYTEGLPAVILIRLSTLWAAVAVGIGFMIFMTARSARASNFMGSPANSSR